MSNLEDKKESAEDFVELADINKDNLKDKRNFWAKHLDSPNMKSSQVWFRIAKIILSDYLKNLPDIKDGYDDTAELSQDIFETMEEYSESLTHFSNEEIGVDKKDEIVKDTTHAFREHGKEINMKEMLLSNLEQIKSADVKNDIGKEGKSVANNICNPNSKPPELK